MGTLISHSNSWNKSNPLIQGRETRVSNLPTRLHLSLWKMKPVELMYSQWLSNSLTGSLRAGCVRMGNGVLNSLPLAKKNTLQHITFTFTDL